MKVLGYIVSYNDREVLPACIDGLRSQDRPLDGFLLVDNASSDGTLELPLPEDVVVIRHEENTGTSGSAATAFQYAMDHDYDWVWVFDADTVPRPDALRNLLEFHEGLTGTQRERVHMICSLPIEARSGDSHHAIVFTDTGYREVEPAADARFYECHGAMWTGSLYSVASIREIGLPNRDYVLDWGDLQYGYEGYRAGRRSFVCLGSVVDHNLHPRETLQHFRFGRRVVRMVYSPPIRCYYSFRNTIHFWLHEYEPHRIGAIVVPHVWMLIKYVVKIGMFVRAPWPVIVACLRGLRDGFAGRLDARY